MLPSLRKINDREFTATDTKVYNPPRELSQYEPRRDQPHDSSRNSAKVKIGGGFKLSNPADEPPKYDSAKIPEHYINQSKTLNYMQKKSSSDLGQEIRMIDKKIRQCQRKVEEDKKRKLEEDRRAQENRYDQDFEQIIKRELELHGYNQPQENKNFDFLTNPGGPQDEPQPEEPQQEEIRQVYSISDGIEKLERFYQNSLKKKFERREIFPHKPCRRKTPKLYITQKTNALNKHGKPLSEEEHKFRIMTKETTPQEIYPVIPNFAVVKDNLSKNIVAYLGDYKPFIEKTKEKVENEIKKSQQDMVVDNSNKSITVSN